MPFVKVEVRQSRCVGASSAKWSYCLCARCTRIRSKLERTGVGPCDGCKEDRPLLRVKYASQADGREMFAYACEDCRQMTLY